MPRDRAYLIAGLAVFGGLLGAWFALGLGDGQGSGEGGVAEAGNLDVFAVEVGDCFDDPPESDVVYSVDTIPCSQPHDNEVFAVDAIAASLGPDFPGVDTMFKFAQDYCRGAPFEDYVGIDYWESELAVWTLAPTLESWAEGDREVVCILYRVDLDRMTGTARNAGI